MNEYQKQTYGSKFFLKRWLHQSRFKETIKILNLRESDRFLDYGCGDGYLLRLLAEKMPAENLSGFEPADEMYAQAKDLIGDKIRLTNNINDFSDIKFDKIACLETCEHLREKDLEKLFVDLKGLIKDGGEIIISVPIEIWLFSTLKNIFRFLKNRHYDNLSLVNFFKAIVGSKINRPQDQRLGNVDYIYSHIGFDYREFEALLKKHFSVKVKKYSPFDFLGAGFNNTVYYICK